MDPHGEAAKLVAANPDLGHPGKVLDMADAMRDSMVPTHPYEMDYWAGRICISVEECRLALGLGEHAMKNAISNGSIPSVKIGGRRLVPVKALERHLEALAYASSGALDAWQQALVQGQAARLKAARRRAWERRRYLRKRLSNAQKAIRAAGSDVAANVLLEMRADLAALERERAVTDRFVRDISLELDGLEADLEPGEG